MIAFLVLLLAAPSAPGCHSTGPSVHCLLAAAVVIPAPKPAPLHHHKPAAVEQHVSKPKPQPKPDQVAAASKPPTDPADIQKHIDSLVAIGDCTGARAAANLLSSAEVADKAFATCVGSVGRGIAQPVTSASSATVAMAGAQRKP